MFSWMTKCCSTGSACSFQKALDNCTYADWNVPAATDLQYIIECYRGQHNQVVRSQLAFSIFRGKFQKHEDKNSHAFRLKNLLLLDRCTEQKCILDLIANYQYNRLFYDRNKVQPSIQNKALQMFICSYYMYIKKKGDIYQRFPDELFQHKTRKSYLNNANNLGRLFQFIDYALQIQKLLNQANQTLKKANKTPLLIQQILTYMLKTYICLYTIVAICLQTLLGKLKSLKFTQLTNLERLLKYFSRDYSNAFLNFLEANKTIPGFKNIQYNQIIKIDQTYMTVFDKYFKLKASEISNPSFDVIPSEKALSIISTPTTIKSSLSLGDSQDLQEGIQEIPVQVYQKLTDCIKFSYEPRNLIQQIASSDSHIFQSSFIDYKNYYSQDFIAEYNVPEVKNMAKSTNLGAGSVVKKDSSKILKKKSIMQDLINEKSLRRTSIKSGIPSKNFKEAVWIAWNNIYCEQN